MYESQLISIIAEQGINIKEKQRAEERVVRSLSKNEIVSKFIAEKAAEDRIDPNSVIACHPSEATVLQRIEGCAAECYKLCGKCYVL